MTSDVTLPNSSADVAAPPAQADPLQGGQADKSAREYKRLWQQACDMYDRKNRSGCCCKFSPDETEIVSPCNAHADWAAALAAPSQAEPRNLVPGLNSTESVRSPAGTGSGEAKAPNPDDLVVVAWRWHELGVGKCFDERRPEIVDEGRMTEPVALVELEDVRKLLAGSGEET